MGDDLLEEALEQGKWYIQYLDQHSPWLLPVVIGALLLALIIKVWRNKGE